MYLLRIVVLYLFDQIVKVKNLQQFQPNSWRSFDHVTISNNTAALGTDLPHMKLGNLLNAFIVMDFHRSKMNEFLCQKFLLSDLKHDNVPGNNWSTKPDRFHKSISLIRKHYPHILAHKYSTRLLKWLGGEGGRDFKVPSNINECQRNGRLLTPGEKTQKNKSNNTRANGRITRSSSTPSILAVNPYLHSNIRPIVYKFQEVTGRRYPEYLSQKWYNSNLHIIYPINRQPHRNQMERKRLSRRPFPYSNGKRRAADVRNAQWSAPDLHYYNSVPNTNIQQTQFTTEAPDIDVITSTVNNLTMDMNYNLWNTDSDTTLIIDTPSMGITPYYYTTKLSTKPDIAHTPSMAMIPVLKPIIMDTSGLVSMPIMKPFLMDSASMMGMISTSESPVIKLPLPIHSATPPTYYLDPYDEKLFDGIHHDQLEWYSTVKLPPIDKAPTRLPSDTKDCACNADNSNEKAVQNENQGFLSGLLGASACEMLFAAVAIVAFAYFSNRFTEQSTEGPSVMIIGGNGNPMVETLRNTTPRTSEIYLNDLLQEILTLIENFQQSTITNIDSSNTGHIQKF